MNLKSKIINLKLFSLYLFLSATLVACDVEIRKTDAQLGLNPQQSAGRRVCDSYCYRFHAPSSSRGKKGRSLKGLSSMHFPPQSGLPATGPEVGGIIRYGHTMMPSVGQA